MEGPTPPTAAEIRAAMDAVADAFIALHGRGGSDLSEDGPKDGGAGASDA